jgi:serine phosphatase RsbU (regulator of sigma subunit)
MSAVGRNEEFISLCVAVFDTSAGTLRYASAGHPAAWLWHEREVQPLRSTGPLVMLDPRGDYVSREIRLDPNDLLLVYTDGLAEARNGDQLFGEERVANALRRDPGVSADVLCKSLLEAAVDFASGPITDDVAILAIRRT